MGIIFIFIEAGDITKDGNLWLYSLSCPDDSMVCSDQSLTNFWGWFTFTLILAVFLLPDFLNGILLFYECSVDFNLQGLFTALMLLNVTLLSVVASSIFIYATSISNIAIIKDAVIVLFLNSIDEQIYMIVERIAPGWVEDIETEIIEFSINTSTPEISEVISFDDSEDDKKCDSLDFDVDSVGRDIKADVGQSYDIDHFEDEYNQKFRGSLLEKSVETGNVSYSVLDVKHDYIHNTDGVDYAVTDDVIDHTAANGTGYSYVDYSVPTGGVVIDSIEEQEEELSLGGLSQVVKRMESNFRKEIDDLKEENKLMKEENKKLRALINKT